jgi:hypothetical protein
VDCITAFSSLSIGAILRTYSSSSVYAVTAWATAAVPLDSRGEDERTALHEAVSAKLVMSVDEVSDSIHRAALVAYLHVQLVHGNTVAAELLVLNGADLNAVDRFGQNGN